MAGDRPFTRGWATKRVSRNSSPRPKRQAAGAGRALAGRVPELPDAVALAADLRRAPRVEARRLDDGRIGRAAGVERVAAQRVPVGGHVRLGRAVARLAGDAELGDGGVDRLIADRLGAERGIEAGLAVRSVAVDADGVPVSVEHRHSLSGGRQHDGVAGRPALLVEQVDGRQHVERALVARRVPVDVLVVRAGDHHHLPGDAGTGARVALPARVVELRPELVAAALQPHRSAWRQVHHTVEVGAHRFGRGHLGHRAVERPVPCRVLRGMARPAGLRRDVAVLCDRDGAMLHGGFGNQRIERDRRGRTQCSRPGDECGGRRERPEPGAGRCGRPHHAVAPRLYRGGVDRSDVARPDERAFSAVHETGPAAPARGTASPCPRSRA